MVFEYKGIEEGKEKNRNGRLVFGVWSKQTKCKSTAKNEADRVKSILKTNPIIPKTCSFQILPFSSFSFSFF